jgi:GntR family transcriptional regulator, histidine utilization repressor
MQRPEGHRSPPAFQRIKDHILGKIRSGEWKEGDVIPTEEVLTRTFGVSRMTVNRALRELAADQILVRVQGSGTFVAQEKYQATLVEIKSIAEEIRARGHSHRSELHLLERVRAKEKQAKQFGLKTGSELFHSLIVHFENDAPIQVEDRWVNKDVAPDYIAQDFTKLTPNEYLMKAAPLQGVQYRIEALLPPLDVADMLRISAQDPCLVLRRKTFSRNEIVSTATMWHPGKRYQFSGEF